MKLLQIPGSMALLALLAAPGAMRADGQTTDAETHGSLAPAGSYDMMNDLPGADKPPYGRSLFDFLTTSNGAQTIPFPFENLVQQLSAASGSVPRVAMIPKGRSLQRDNADFAQPRIIVGFDGGVLQNGNLGHAHMAVTNQLFMGYAEKANQVEVISFNKAAGRFEFQVVKDYRQGGAMLVSYENRSLCTKCHHSGSPTFGPAPWTETNATGVTANEQKIVDLMKQAMGGNDTFHGFSVSVQKDIPYGISDAANDANMLMPYQKMWTDGCGKDDAKAPRCRGYALQFALEMQMGAAPGGATPQAMPSFQQLQAQYWQSSFGTGLSVPTHALVAYNPLVDTSTAAENCQPSTTSAPVVPGSGPNDGFPDLQPGLSNGQLMQITQMLAATTVPRAKDPLCHVEPPLPLKTLAHCQLCVVFGVRAFLYDSDGAWVKQAAGGSAQKLAAAIDSMVQKNSPALANRAFRRNVALAALAAELGVAPPEDPAFDGDNPAMPPANLDSDTGTAQPGDSPLALMKVYCAPCHVQLPGKKGFLKGATDDIVTAQVRGEKDEILVRLGWVPDQPGAAIPDEDPDHPYMPLQGDPKRTALAAKPSDAQAIKQWVKSL